MAKRHILHPQHHRPPRYQLPRTCREAGGGKGILIQEEHTGALQTNNNQHVLAKVFAAQGNGGGEVAPTMTGDHNGHISDYTAIVTGPLMASGYSKNGTQEAMNGMYVIEKNDERDD